MKRMGGLADERRKDSECRMEVEGKERKGRPEVQVAGSSRGMRMEFSRPPVATSKTKGKQTKRKAKKTRERGRTRTATSN